MLPRAAVEVADEEEGEEGEEEERAEDGADVDDALAAPVRAFDCSFAVKGEIEHARGRDAGRVDDLQEAGVVGARLHYGGLQ